MISDKVLLLYMLIIENPINLDFSHNKITCGETLFINLRVIKKKLLV